jgi:hypothetical protein
MFSSFTFPVAAKYSQLHKSSVFWLDRGIVSDSIDKCLKHIHDDDDALTKRVQEIKQEGWDLFLRVLGDGSVVLTAVAVRTIH